jgi:hypothetical protein
MFDTVSNSWLIGMPDDPQRTRVIYVLDKPVACAEIVMAGWDKTVTDATQAIEIKLIGTMAGTYPVATSGQPATGQADVNYSLTSRTATPMEDLAKGGTRSSPWPISICASVPAVASAWSRSISARKNAVQSLTSAWS